MYTTYSSVLARPGHVLSDQKRMIERLLACMNANALYHVAQQYSAFMFVSPLGQPTLTARARAQKAKAGKSKTHEAERVLPPPRNPTLLFAELGGLLDLLAHVVGLHANYTVAQGTYRRTSSFESPQMP